jgi:RNA polymerase sigma-70 factor (ECF subfamily)
MHRPLVGCNKNDGYEDDARPKLAVAFFRQTLRRATVQLTMSQNDPGNQGRSEEDAEDVRLMGLVGQGDTHAFEQLVEKHQALVAGTVARMLGSSSDVEDIAQQVFIRVWKSARRYVPRAKFTTWLLKITRNLVFNEMRRIKRRPHIPLQPEQGAENAPFRDETNPAPDASLLELELQQAIEDAIQQLPETQRMALVLRRYEQLSYEQIAEVLDLSVPAVKSVLFRARTELRSRLSKYLDL